MHVWRNVVEVVVGGLFFNCNIFCSINSNTKGNREWSWMTWKQKQLITVALRTNCKAVINSALWTCVGYSLPLFRLWTFQHDRVLFFELKWCWLRLTTWWREIQNLTLLYNWSICWNAPLIVLACGCSFLRELLTIRSAFQFLLHGATRWLFLV